MPHWYETLNYDVLNLICQNLHPLEWIQLLRCSKHHLDLFQYFMPSPKQSTYKTIKYFFNTYDINTCEKLLLENIRDRTLNNIDFILYRMLEITKDDDIKNTVFYRLYYIYRESHREDVSPLMGDKPLDIVVSISVRNFLSDDLIHWLIKNDSDFIGMIRSVTRYYLHEEKIIKYAVKYNKRHYILDFTSSAHSKATASYEIAKYDNWQTMWSTFFSTPTINLHSAAMGAIRYKNYECLKASVKEAEINSILHKAIDAEDYTAIKIIKDNSDFKELQHNVFSWARSERMICFLLELGFKWTEKYAYSNFLDLNKKYPHTKKIDYSKYFSDVDNNESLLHDNAPRELYEKMAKISNRKIFRQWLHRSAEKTDILLSLGFEVHFLHLVRRIIAFNCSLQCKMYYMKDIMNKVQKYPQNIVLSNSDLYDMVTDQNVPEEMIKYALLANVDSFKDDIRYIEKAYNIKVKQMLFEEGFAIPSNFIEKNVNYLDDVLVIIKYSNKRLEINDEVVVSIALKYPITTLEVILSKVKVVVRKSCKMDPSMQLKRNNKKASEVLRRYGL